MNAALGFGPVDYAAVAFFLCAWGGYHLAVETLGASRRSLNTRMAEFRRTWMRVAVARDNRIVDSTIMASLQSGAAFFASTALLAVGAVLALFQGTDTALALFGDLPFGLETTRLGFEAKVFGLGVIFVYAFFKFAWSYRLFNYAAILLGAIPPEKEGPAADAGALRAAEMTIVAGRHFNRGQRAFFFALAYLGWFVGPWVLIGATAAVLGVMAHRQFASDALKALGEGT